MWGQSILLLSHGYHLGFLSSNLEELLLLFLNVYHFATFILTAIRTNCMGEAHLTAITALDQITWC